MAVAERTWPTVAEVEQVVAQLDAAMDAVDGPTNLGYLDLVERITGPGDPDLIYALRAGVPRPSYADIGLLSTLVERLKYERGELDDWITGLEALQRSVAVKTDA